jgi:CBS domain containing-hemolysin-like protein
MCSLFEAVLYSVPVSFIETIAESGRPSGRILQRLRGNIDRPIAAVLSLNTIANTAGAAISGAIATAVLGSAWLGVFSGVFTLAILLFSEIIPKTIGVVHNRRLAPVVAWPLQLLVWVLTPFIWLTSLVTRTVAGSHEPHQTSVEELLVLARLGLRKGVIDKNKALVIQNILSLEAKYVSEIMTPRTVVFSLSGELTVDEARKAEGFYTHSRIPVYFKNPEDIAGIVHRRNVLNRAAEDELNLKLESLMKPVHFVMDKTRLDKTLKLFLERNEQMFIALDEYGGLSGVITLEDVLEEILGTEIVDEFDEVADLRQLAHQRRERVLRESQDLGEKGKPHFE